jgi:hypothetical protein
MDIEVTATSEVRETAVAALSGAIPNAETFGTRPRTDRPHSISLFGSDRNPTRDGASRGLDVLLGVGIGAAVMYYLDPDCGQRRRAAVLDKVVGAMATAFRGTPDAGGWERSERVGSARP